MRTKLGLLGLVVVGLVAGSLALSGAALADGGAAGGAGAKHHHHGAHGKIESFDATSITIKAHHHKKGEAGAAATEESKTFKITDKTKIEIIDEAGDKKPGTAADLKVGEHVMIGGHEGVAEVIAIGGHHHKKKAAA